MSREEFSFKPYASANKIVVTEANTALVKAVQTLGIGFRLTYTVSASFVTKEVVGFKNRSLVFKPYVEDLRQDVVMKLMLGVTFPLGIVANMYW